MKNVLTCLICLLCNMSFAQKVRNSYVKISTPKGDMVALLYNQTPTYRDNFIKLTKSGFYDGTLFHRVIKGFMIQGGDPDSRNAPSGKGLGSGNVDYQIPADFQDSLYHKKGALAAARDNNPDKASSGCQFYIVQGKTYSDTELKMIENSKGIKIADWQKRAYKNYGGTPFLDHNYSVFGEVVRGIEVLDEIAKVKTDENDRPEVNVQMKVSLLKKREVKRLEKELLQEAFRKRLIMK